VLPDLPSLVTLIDETATPLDRISAAEDVAAQLTGLGDRLIGYYIEQARAEGCSWTDIGGHLGVSRQAAQQRYTPRWTMLTLADLFGAGAFQRVTARTRAALTRAEDHARRLRAGSVGAGHLLLSILDTNDTLGAKAIRKLTDPATLRTDLETTLPAGETASPVALPLGVDARRTLEAALAEALEFGHNYIGTEHLLLGLIRDSATGKLLNSHGITSESAHQAVRDLFL
jgi:hypothetical protein